MSHPAISPHIDTQDVVSGRWMVVIFNNEVNSMEEVVDVLILATGCSREEAEIEMWEAHTFGKAPVHFAARSECDDAALIISAIGIQTEVCPEWEE